MFDYDRFEEEGAGHKITMVHGLTGGITTYYCEHCGALVQVGGPENGLVLFHVPPGSLSTEELCVKAGTIPSSLPAEVARKAMQAALERPQTSLRDKLQKLEDESMERLRRI